MSDKDVHIPLRAIYPFERVEYVMKIPDSGYWPQAVYRAPWLELWKSGVTMLFKIRLELRKNLGTFAATELVIPYAIANFLSHDGIRFIEDPSWHFDETQEHAIEILDNLTGVSTRSFEAPGIHGYRKRRRVDFTGKVSSLDDIKAIAEALGVQVLMMHSDLDAEGDR